MSIVFFDGFNSNTTNVNFFLDSNYWTFNTSDISINTSGRTGRALSINNSVWSVGNGLQNRYIDLVNFNSPLDSNNALGLGFAVSQIKNNTNFITIFNDNVEILRFNIERPEDSQGVFLNSLVIAVYQNGSLITTYDLKSAPEYNYSFGNWGFSSISGFVIPEYIYLEFYIDAKDTNSLRIRANNLNLLNSSGQTSTSITPFTNLDKIRFFGGHDNSQGDTFSLRSYDDLYLTGGNSISDTLLGSDTRIHLYTTSNIHTTEEWNTTGFSSAIDLRSNDGDSSFVFSDQSDITNDYVTFRTSSGDFTNVFVGGVKVMSTARSPGNVNNSFTHTITNPSDNSITEIGTNYVVDSSSYRFYSDFFLQHPLTNSDWTLDDLVNNMYIGIRKKS
jgi:hypothetical protein